MLLSPCFPVWFINWDRVCWEVFDCVHAGCALVGALFPAICRAHVCLPSCSGRATVPEPSVWKWWWRLCLVWFHVFQELLPVLESPLTCWVCMALPMALQNESPHACSHGCLKLPLQSSWHNRDSSQSTQQVASFTPSGTDTSSFQCLCSSCCYLSHEGRYRINPG